MDVQSDYFWVPASSIVQSFQYSVEVFAIMFNKIELWLDNTFIVYADQMFLNDFKDTGILETNVKIT